MSSPSIFQLAARAGLPIGLLLTFMSACMLLSIHYPSLPLALVGVILIPICLLIYMRRIATRLPVYNKFVPLWLFAMYSIIFGTLICTLLSALYVTFLEPDFINVYIDTTMAQLNNNLSGELLQAHQRNIDLINMARERHLLPSPLEFISSLAWSTAFFGTLLSIPLALITVRRRRVAGNIV